MENGEDSSASSTTLLGIGVKEIELIMIVEEKYKHKKLRRKINMTLLFHLNT